MEPGLAPLTTRTLPERAPPPMAPDGAPARPPKRDRLSPINRRRWRNFKANRRGYWSFWVFLALFLVTLFAEFIANDKPFLVRFRRPYLLPGARSPIRKRISAAISRPRRTIATATSSS